MKVEDFDRVKGLIEDRRKWNTHYDNVYEATLNWLGVTLYGQYQDDRFVSVMRPHVLKEIERRLGCIDEELKHLGVEP